MRSWFFLFSGFPLLTVYVIYRAVHDGADALRTTAAGTLIASWAILLTSWAASYLNLLFFPVGVVIGTIISFIQVLYAAKQPRWSHLITLLVLVQWVAIIIIPIDLMTPIYIE